MPRTAPGSSTAGHPGPRRDPAPPVLPVQSTGSPRTVPRFRAQPTVPSSGMQSTVPGSGTQSTVPGSGTTAATLLLNATYEPLCVVSSRRAIVLVLAEKAVSVDSAAEVVRAETVSVAVPVVVRLTRFVRVPYPASVPLSRRAVFTRDGQTCVYCGGSATSIDHVVPRSRGGTHTWDNVVAACRRCNHTKADRSLAELGWKLPHPPRTPSGAAWRLLGSRTVDPRWREWLGMPESVSA